MSSNLSVETISIDLTSHEQVIRNEFEKLAKESLHKGYLKVDTAMRHWEDMNENLKHDKIFQQFFPLIFQMELVKEKIKTENSPE